MRLEEDQVLKEVVVAALEVALVSTSWKATLQMLNHIRACSGKDNTLLQVACQETFQLQSMSNSSKDNQVKMV